MVSFRGAGATGLGNDNTTDGAGERSATAGDEEAAVLDAATARYEGGVKVVRMGVGVGGSESVELGLTALSTDIILLAVALVLVEEDTEAAVEWAAEAEAVSRHGERGVKTEGV